jgi:hypothetical protein
VRRLAVAFMNILKNILRFVTAILGTAFVLLALAVPVGVLSVCYEGGCTDTRQEHWFLNIAGLAFIAFALCLSSLIIAAVLFFYARHGALRTNKPGATATK